MTKGQVLRALAANGGLALHTGNALGISREAVLGWLKRHPDLKEAANKYREAVSDVAMGHLVTAVKAGKWDQVRFWLTTQAKDRGFGMQAQVDVQHKLSDEDLEAIVGAFGGDLEKLRDLRSAVAARVQG